MSEPRRAYFLSPHADDAVFSCGGTLALLGQTGHEVSLITACLSGPHAPDRLREDRRAASLLGATHHNLSLPDAPDRPEIRGALGVFSPYGPAHLGVANELFTRLLPLLRLPADLYAPLAVGGHIDHHLTHHAARALAYACGPALRLFFYEDIPYAWTPFALARRLRALGQASLEVPAVRVQVAAYRHALLRYPLAAGWLPGVRHLQAQLAAQAAVGCDLHATASSLPGPRPRLVPVDMPVGQTALVREAAVAAYTSQWPLFFASPADHTDRMRVHSAGFDPPGAAERLWRDDGAYVVEGLRGEKRQTGRGSGEAAG